MASLKLRDNQMMAAPYFGQTLIFNGGFERWTHNGTGPFINPLPNTEVADNWFVLDQTSAGNLTISQQSAPPVSGNYHIQIQLSGTPAPRGIWQPLLNDIEFVGSVGSLEPRVLSFSAWVYTTTPGDVRLVLAFYNGTSWIEYVSNTHSGTGWEKLNVYGPILYPLVPDPSMLFKCIYVGIRGTNASFSVDNAVCVAGQFDNGPEYIPYEPSTSGVAASGDTVEMPVLGLPYPMPLVGDVVVCLRPSPLPPYGIMPADCFIIGHENMVAGIVIGFNGPNAIVQFEGEITNPNWINHNSGNGLIPGLPVYAGGSDPTPGPHPGAVPGGIFQFWSPLLGIGMTEGPLPFLQMPTIPHGVMWLQKVGVAVGPIQIELTIEEATII